MNRIGSEESGGDAGGGDDDADSGGGDGDTGGGEKVDHIIYMHSQDKAAADSELRAWAEKRQISECIAQYKLDGVSIELQYRRGALAVAVTRGDGARGDDVTDNIRRIAAVPTQIDSGFSGGVRGEIILPLAAHKKHYPQFANCRNTAAGIIKRKDGVGSSYLRIICYDALHSGAGDYFADNRQLLMWLNEQRFSVVKWRLAKSIDDVIRWHGQVAEKRAALKYEIDGLVVKTPAIMADDRLLAKPKYQIAFKFRVEERTATLEQVIWNQSGHQYTPIAVIDAVQLAGTTVRRASLVNMRLIRDLGLHIGATVAVTKRGEIIPKIERLVRAAKKPIAIAPPARCGNCDTELIVEDTRVYCPNIDCPQRLRHQLRRWIEVLEIKEFGEVLIRDLHKSGVLRSIADLYRLQIDDIAGLERQGKRSAENALQNLHRVTRLPLSTFIAALNIENVGRKTMQKLIDSGYDSIDRLLTMTPEQIVDIDGIGEIMAQHICAGIAANRDNIARILAASHITFDDRRHGGALAGQSFCFTGTLDTMSRKQAAAAVEAAGGEVRSAVSAQVSYVVTNNPGSDSAKLKSARAHRVAIIDEREFLRLIGRQRDNGQRDDGQQGDGRE